jgi:hypothetical protein
MWAVGRLSLLSRGLTASPSPATGSRAPEVQQAAPTPATNVVVVQEAAPIPVVDVVEIQEILPTPVAEVVSVQEVAPSPVVIAVEVQEATPVRAAPAEPIPQQPLRRLKPPEEPWQPRLGVPYQESDEGGSVGKTDKKAAVKIPKARKRWGFGRRKSQESKDAPAAESVDTATAPPTLLQRIIKSVQRFFRSLFG